MTLASAWSGGRVLELTIGRHGFGHWRCAQMSSRCSIGAEVDSSKGNSDFLSEYRSGTAFSSSLNEINSRLRSLEESIPTNLSEYHQFYRPVASKVAENSADLSILQTDINKLSSEYHTKIKPCMDDLKVSVDEVSFKGSPSSIHSQAVQKLEDLLKTYKSLQHLLDIHNAIQSLDACTISLLRTCSVRNQVKHLCHNKDLSLDLDDSDISDDEQFNVDSYLYAWKSDIPVSCGAIELEVREIANVINKIESLLDVRTLYEKSQVVLYQAFMGTFFGKKRILREFLEHYWSNMVRIVPEPKVKSILGKFELIGKTADLQSLINLADALHETEKLVQSTGRRIWEVIFMPWLNYITSKKKDEQQDIILNVDQSFSAENEELWRLQLLSIEDEHKHGLNLIYDSCESLKSTLEKLSAVFFGLRCESGRLLIDFCRSSPGPFNMQLAEPLVEGCFLPNLSSSLTSSNESIVECDEEAVSKILLVTKGAISPVISIGKDLGYFDSKAVEYLEDFVENLDRFTVQHQDQVYAQALVTILSDEANLTSLVKVGGCDGDHESSKENMSKVMSESQLEEAELSKLFQNVNLEFPECFISKAVVMLLKQVDQIIEDAKGYEKDQIPMILKRVPHLIHLYSHFVPTLHAERMKSDLRFVTVYHNDCMYLAHQCLSLGRRKIFPFVESLGLGTGLQTAASLSTLHLVTPLRDSATSALMDHLRTQKSLIHEKFNSSRGLKDCAGEGSEVCERAILGCISLLLTVFKSIDPLPVTIYLRFLGVLTDEFIRLLCDAVINLGDIITMECSILLRYIDSVIKAVVGMFEKHLDAAFKPCYGSSLSKSEEKSVTILLEKRVASWQRLQSLRAILSAASLEEVRALVIPSDTKNPLFRCHLSKSDEIPRLIVALFRPSNARSTLLKDLAESS
nr:centromere:kinetochore protein zw10 [Hymenolepis microstoma]